MLETIEKLWENDAVMQDPIHPSCSYQVKPEIRDRNMFFNQIHSDTELNE